MPTLTFTNGNDSYTVSGTGSYTLSFLGGADSLAINGGDFTSADMGSGNDRVRAFTGQASVYGGTGQDRYDIWSDNFFGDAGDDNDTINIRGGYAPFVLGGAGRDIFTVFADVTYIAFGGGDGNDVFFGNYHSLPLGFAAGGPGDDRFFEFGSYGGSTFELQGGPGNDMFRIDPASPPNIIEQAGEGIDTVQVPLGTAYVLPENVENLRVLAIPGSTSGAGTLLGNALNNIIIASTNDDQIQGLDGNDWLYGRGGNDLLDGGAGKNNLSGGDGNDQLIGGNLRDVLNGGAGDDVMSGGLGNDIYYVDGLGDSVLEDPGGGTDMVWSSAPAYNLPTNIENGAVQGSAGVILGGNSADNILTGGPGADTLSGYGGNDNIRGGGGNDSIDGGSGADRITGGAGADSMTGGAAGDIDTFVYAALSESTPGAMDHITSFETDAGDVIDLRAIDSDTALAGNQDFVFGGSNPTAHGIWWVATGVADQYYIYGDVNGDTTPDFAILLDVIGLKPVLHNFDGVMAGN